MSDALRGCPGCSRHVRASETACPFCGASHAGLPAPVAPRRVRGLTRSAIFAGALLGAACGSSGAEPADEPDEHTSGDEVPDRSEPPQEGHPPEENDAEEREGQVVPLYGGPPAEALV